MEPQARESKAQTHNPNNEIQFNESNKKKQLKERECHMHKPHNGAIRGLRGNRKSLVADERVCRRRKPMALVKTIFNSEDERETQRARECQDPII